MIKSIPQSNSTCCIQKPNNCLSRTLRALITVIAALVVGLFVACLLGPSYLSLSAGIVAAIAVFKLTEIIIDCIVKKKEQAKVVATTVDETPESAFESENTNPFKNDSL